MRKQVSDKMKQLLVRSGSQNISESLEATAQLAKALELPLRKGVFAGDVLGNIFETVPLEVNATPEFPLHFIAPGTEKDHVAYTIPNHGTLPRRNIEGDYVTVPIYDIGNAIDWTLKYARDARWDIVAGAMEVLEAGFTKKINDDGWHVLLSAAVDRNIVVFDSDAAQGQFTKRLVSLAKTVMRRNAGGNSSSLRKGRLTDLYLSPEGIEDMRNWGVDQVDDTTRREIFVAGDEMVMRIFNVNLHDMYELGVGQEYQTFFTSDLSGSLATSHGSDSHNDTELAVGLDLSNRDSFVRPLKEDIKVFPDDWLHRQRMAGVYGWMSHGLAALDNRRVIALSF